MLLVKLFGTPLIEAPSGPVTGRAAQGRRFALLALLACARRRAVTRDKLIALLWPELTTDRARHQLSDTLYILRGALGDDVIRSGGDDLVLNPDAITSDAATFDRMLDEGRLEAAVELVTGPLLDGFYLTDSSEFEHWLDAERTRLGGRYAAALESLAEAAEAREEFTAATSWWRRLAAHDPHSGRVALRLMHLFEAAGDRAAALKQAQIHASLMREEFDTGPDPLVTAFAERLRLEPPSRSVPEPAPRRPMISMNAIPAAPSPYPTALPARDSPARRPRTSRLVSWVAVLTLGFAGIAAGIRYLTGRGSVLAVSGLPAQSIAVLPFVNLGANPEEEFIGDGLTEELITALSRLRALRVVARTSVFAFKGETRDIREIGRALNVATVLEGSFRKEGDRIRVTAQLINTEDGFHIWSAVYDERRVEDLFDIQRDVAVRIAGALEAELTPRDRERLARRPTENPDAHLLYLKGRYFLSRVTSGSLATAIEYFERAITADPRYAEAHAGLASAYAPLGIHGYASASEARERMKQAALHAIEIDPDLAEARTALAAYRQLYEWDFPAAEREFRLAIALDPDYPVAHRWYGLLLESMGRFEEAVAEIGISVGLDPLNANASSLLGFALFRAGHIDSALERVEQAIELDSASWIAHNQLGQIREAMGQPAAAIRAYERAVVHSGAAPKQRAALARSLALTGREEEARRMLRSLREEAKETGAHTPVVATLFLALGDVDGAIVWLESAYRERHPDLLRLTADLRFAALRGDPRFVDLLDRIGLARRVPGPATHRPSRTSNVTLPTAS